MMPWLGDNFANDMAMAVLASIGIDVEKQQRLERRMVDETLERCGFRAECREAFPRELGKMETEIVNAQGEPLNREEKEQLAKVFQEVRKEHLQRLKEAKEARLRAEAAEKARKQAEYDASAAPYREERRRRKAEAWAKRQPKTGQC